MCRGVDQLAAAALAIGSADDRVDMLARGLVH